MPYTAQYGVNSPMVFYELKEPKLYRELTVMIVNAQKLLLDAFVEGKSLDLRMGLSDGTVMNFLLGRPHVVNRRGILGHICYACGEEAGRMCPSKCGGGSDEDGV